MTTFQGSRVSDGLAAVLEHAEASGFRIENTTTGGRRAVPSFTAYPPDTSHPPVRISERGTNRAHIDNVTRSLIAAGMPDPRPHAAAAEPTDPTDTVIDLTTEEPTVSSAPRAARRAAAKKHGGHDHLTNMQRTVAEIPPEEHEHFIVAVLTSLATATEMDERIGDLATSLFIACRRFSQEADLGGEKARAEVEAAVKLAEEAEHRATTAERAAEKARAAGAETGRQVTDLLARCEAAEARARELDAAIAPLRAILGQPAGA